MTERRPLSWRTCRRALRPRSGQLGIQNRVRSAVFVGPPRRSSAAGLQPTAGEQAPACILTPSGPPGRAPTDTSVKQQALPRLSSTDAVPKC